MSLPTMNGVGRLTAEPELRYSASGSPVVKVRLAFNSRKKDPQSGEWKDDAVAYVQGTVFGPMAESVAESLQQGMEVVVSGRLKTNSWEDQSGQKRSVLELVVDSIGPSLRSATARVTKVGSGGQGGQSRRGQQQPAGDPWAASASAGARSGGWGASSGGGGYSGEAPPF